MISAYQCDSAFTLVDVLNLECINGGGLLHSYILSKVCLWAVSI